MSRRRVFVASPFAGDRDLHEEYARAAMLDCLRRGEAPIVVHLMYPQVLDDDVPEDRLLAGQAAGSFLSGPGACTLVVYADLGISGGMWAEINYCIEHGTRIEPRSLDGWPKETP